MKLLASCRSLAKLRVLALAAFAVVSAPAQIVIDDPIPAPVFSPVAASFQDSLVVAITASTPGASIYFTLDGSTPTLNSFRYAAPFVLKSTTTVRAIAIRNAQRSPVATAVYVRAGQAATPVASPSGRFYEWAGAPLTITLSTATPGATILYTLDGSTPGPGANSLIYSGPFVLTVTTTVKAIAVKPDLLPSGVLTETYTRMKNPVDPMVSAPMMEPAGVTFVDSLRITFTAADTAARICFTLDGSNPTPASTQFRSGQSIILVQSATVKAMALLGGGQSPVVTQHYQRVTTGLRGNGAAGHRAARFHPAWAWEGEGRRLDGARTR